MLSISIDVLQSKTKTLKQRTKVTGAPENTVSGADIEAMDAIELPNCSEKVTDPIQLDKHERPLKITRVIYALSLEKAFPFLKNGTIECTSQNHGNAEIWCAPNHGFSHPKKTILYHHF